jgi:hypothetical protein
MRDLGSLVFLPVYAGWKGDRSMYVPKFLMSAAIAVMSMSSLALAGMQIDPVEDVMTSAFFSGPNYVRGYAGDNRNVHRVATDNAFGVGPETIYITFDAADFTGLTSPVPSATLTVQSASGGFGADAGPGNPFTVSAHAVNADPLASITDDTNPGGPISWINYFNNNILTADPAALTSIDGFGPVTFDVTSIVNDWLDGSNTIFAIALTGTNDTSGNGFLHGFLNNTESPGSTFLTVVPEPASVALIGLGGVALIARRRR